MPIPAFSNSSRNSDRESTGNACGSFDWKDLVDTPETFAVTIMSRDGTFDLTPRRLRQFKPKPGESVAWRTEAVPGRRAKQKPEPQSGTVKVEANGVFTIKGLKYPDGRSPEMTVTVTKGVAKP
jgi:hypothetical protein